MILCGRRLAADDYVAALIAGKPTPTSPLAHERQPKFLRKRGWAKDGHYF